MDSPLLRAILEHPDDDDRRLVYADWLEERGDVDRAQFIRDQIQRPYYVSLTYQRIGAQVQISAPAFHERSLRWPDAKGLPIPGVWSGFDLVTYIFRRGFVAELKMAWVGFLECAPSIFSKQPVVSVEIPHWQLPSNRAVGSTIVVNHPTVPGELVIRHEQSISEACVAFGRQSAGLPPLHAESHALPTQNARAPMKSFGFPRTSTSP